MGLHPDQAVQHRVDESPRRFVPRATLAEAAVLAPRVDARRFSAEIDAVVDQSSARFSPGEFAASTSL